MRSIVGITAGLLVLSAQVDSFATIVQQSDERLGTGVVVESAAAGSAAARAGMRTGDFVSAWSRSTGGDTRALPIATVFNLAESRGRASASSRSGWIPIWSPCRLARPR